MAGLVAGLYGKLPAHGDFVQRGWNDATVAALDTWLDNGAAALRAQWGDEAWAARLGEAPAWRGHLPGAMAGGEALHLALAPSIDRPGRLFFITAGWAGDDDAVAAQVEGDPAYPAQLDQAIYDAVAGRLDADALVASLGSMPQQRAVSTPAREARWWPLGAPADALPAVYAATLDPALLQRLLEVPA